MRFLMINKHLIVVIAIATYPDFRHTVSAQLQMRRLLQKLYENRKTNNYLWFSSNSVEFAKVLCVLSLKWFHI